MKLPPLSELQNNAIVASLPMRVKFRGISRREVLLVQGPAGWGEFGPFPEYDDPESAWWLAAAVEAAYLGPPDPVREKVPINATVPAVDAKDVPAVLSCFPGARTAKVKVAEPGQSLDHDVDRIQAVREQIPNIRVDANGGWTVTQAIKALNALGSLEYAEQPCRTIEELAQLRASVATPIAADESIRRINDPLKVVRQKAADIAVLKVAPLGGMRRVLALAKKMPIPVVISSALDSAVGISAGVATAAALPHLSLACGLGTGTLFTHDVAEPFVPHNGSLSFRTVELNQSIPLADPVSYQWWMDRLTRCYALLEDVGVY